MTMPLHFPAGRALGAGLAEAEATWHRIPKALIVLFLDLNSTNPALPRASWTFRAKIGQNGQEVVRQKSFDQDLEHRRYPLLSSLVVESIRSRSLPNLLDVEDGEPTGQSGCICHAVKCDGQEDSSCGEVL
jgi:hypothetical protein